MDTQRWHGVGLVYIDCGVVTRGLSVVRVSLFLGFSYS